MSDLELFNHAKRVIENGGELERKTCRSLIEWLEAAERERDELRAEQAEHDEQIARMESKFSLAKRALDSKTARCEKAEAELRRRDAAAGEPYGYVHKSLYEAVGSAGLSNDHEAYRDSPTHIALYTAAPPAVLPSEVEELSMQIRRLVHSLKNSNPDSSLLKSVPDYMQRKGYWKITDCLRGEHD